MSGSQSVCLHLKVLTEPTRFTRDDMVAAMWEVYQTVDIDVEIASVESLDLPLLTDLDVSDCRMGLTTAEQNELFAHRNNAAERDLVVYFVRSTVPPLNGCASHPAGLPSAVVTSTASRWTVGHEVGHVLGLNHVESTDRLMTCKGTNLVTNPPPDLDDAERQQMHASEFTTQPAPELERRRWEKEAADKNKVGHKDHKDKENDRVPPPGKSSRTEVMSFPGAGMPGDPDIRGRLAGIKRGAGLLAHFIDASLRPDLSVSALGDEEADRGEVRPPGTQVQDRVRDTEDLEDAEEPYER